MKTFDCVIIGAGPAGASAATHLARAGLHVTLIDRATFPRAKACGDCLSPGANPLLDRLGVLDAVRASGAALRGWRVFAPSGTHFEARFDRITTDPLLARACAVDRTRLDSILLDAARLAGVEVLNARVMDIVSGDDFHAVICQDEHDRYTVRGRLLVGADGLRSIVSRRCGLIGRPPRLHKASLTAHTRVHADALECGELHVIDGACVGIAPIERATADSQSTPHCNVSLVVDSSRFGRDIAADAHAFFAAMLHRFPGLRGRLVEPPEKLLGSGPFDRPTRSVVANGVALVGDAAGYFDPFTGQGIYHALAAAEHLAACANDAFRTGSPRRPLARYARRHAALVRGSRRVQQMIDRVCANPALLNRVVSALDHSPRVAERLTAVTADILPARCLLSPALVLTFLTRLLTPEMLSADH